MTDHGPSTIIFHGATVLQLIVLSCALILNYIHIQDTVGGFSSLFLPPVVKRHFSNKYEIYDFLIHLFDLGFFFQRFDPSLLLRPFLIPKDESLFRKNIETFSSLVFCLVFSYLGLFNYLSTMDIEYYKSHTSIRPCSLRICFN